MVSSGHLSFVTGHLSVVSCHWILDAGVAPAALVEERPKMALRSAPQLPGA